MEYARPPSDPSIMTTGVPDSRVRFTVIETVKGHAIQELVLPGYLVSTDDFNDKPAPYSFVRPGGRAGSCFANSYRRDAQYLLFLKKPKDSEFTFNWAALAPFLKYQTLGREEGPATSDACPGTQGLRLEAVE